MKMSTEGEARRPMRGTTQGPEQLVKTTGYSTTMALSTLRKLLGTQYLRRGDGILTTTDSRHKERLFGAGGTGRLTLGSRGVKLEKLRGDGYDPREDTCIAAFIRLMEAAAVSSESPESNGSV